MCQSSIHTRNETNCRLSQIESRCLSCSVRLNSGIQVQYCTEKLAIDVLTGNDISQAIERESVALCFRRKDLAVSSTSAFADAKC